MVVRHEIRLRLRAIELLAFWEGRLVTNSLMTWFGISRQQASSDIRRYIDEINPNSLFHDPSVKGYVPAGAFRPVLTQGHINEYLELIAGMALEPSEQVLESIGALAVVQLPDRSVKPEVLRELLKACRQSLSLNVHYASMANPIFRERAIAPHSLVYTGFRWHVRAYCYERGEFRDFLLSRIDRTTKLQSDSTTETRSSEDHHWQEYLNLSIVPNPRLSKEQIALVERDFSMPDGRLTLNVRKALIHYTLQRYQVALSEEDASNPLKFPLVVGDTVKNQVAPYLFGFEA